MFKLVNGFRRMRRCKKGGTAIEFAIVAGLLFTFLFGIIEFAMYSLASVLLEGSMREASRFGITGFTPTGVSREDRIKTIVDNTTMGLVDTTDASFKLDVLVYPSFQCIGKPEPYTDTNGNGSYDAGEPYTDVNGNGKWDEDVGISGAGGPGDVVLYAIRYDWPLWSYLATLIGGPDGKLPLSSSMAVLNEPSTGATTPSGTTC
ncbi:MAG: pilus assembly protein [Alphaproteobacteria bacterium]|nr:pilus assembly protein [Alphaproteobacteria bacterium]